MKLNPRIEYNAVYMAKAHMPRALARYIFYVIRFGNQRYLGESCGFQVGIS